MDYFHSIALFYDRIVIAPEYRPVQIIYDNCPASHDRIRLVRMYTDRKGSTVLDQRL